MKYNFTPQNFITHTKILSSSIDDILLEEMLTDDDIFDAFEEEAEKIISATNHKKTKINKTATDLTLMQYAAAVQHVGFPKKFPFIFNS